METLWISVLSCALISLPLAGVAKAQTIAAQESSAAPGEFTLASASSQPSNLSAYPAATHVARNLNWTAEAPGGPAGNLTASAAESNAALLGAPGLWTAEDSIRLSSNEKFDAGQETAPRGPDTSNCRWTAVISNAWDCKIKHLGRYDLSLQHAAQHLWPLHRGNSQ